MPTYAVGFVLLLSMMISLSRLDNEENCTYHMVYADDLAGGGKIFIYDHVGTSYWKRDLLLGYFPKVSKSWLISKKKKLEEAKELFLARILTSQQWGEGILVGSLEKKWQEMITLKIL